MRYERSVLFRARRWLRETFTEPMTTGRLSDRPSARDVLRQIRREGEMSMRRAAKVDGNQPEIVAFVRANGWSAQSLAMVGKGCPDVLIGKRWLHAILEIKLPGEGLNDQQKDWHGRWNGEVHMVESVSDAALVLTALEERLR